MASDRFFLNRVRNLGWVQPRGLGIDGQFFSRTPSIVGDQGLEVVFVGLGFRLSVTGQGD